MIILKIAEDLPKSDPLWKVSNPKIVQQKAYEYFKKPIRILKSNRKDKKYVIIEPKTNKLIYFGSMMYQDHTFHNNDKRRDSYLKRSAGIKGDWKKNKFSPNNLSRNLLW